jgi:hypothetical protein
MSKPPPDNLKDWSKNSLVREVGRLRAILREHAERPGGDPREASTSDAIVGGSGPYSRGDVLLDARSAVLLDGVDVSLVDTKQGDAPVMFLVLKGRINFSEDRVEHAYLFGSDGAAGLVTEVIGLAQRAGEGFGSEFADDLTRRMRELP